MTTFELQYRKFESNTQRHQLSNTFQLKIELLFENLETEYSDITAEHYSTMIETIVNRKFCNTFNHQNGPNQCQYVHKHTGQQYQSRYLQISGNFSPQ